MSNRPKNIKPNYGYFKSDFSKYSQSTPEEPQHTAQFSRVGFLILVAVSIVSISLIIILL